MDMRQVYRLNGKEMTSKGKAYAHIERQIPCPLYFGRNLDALWDVLMALREADIVIDAPEYIQKDLGDYGGILLDLFSEAGVENPTLTVEALFPTSDAQMQINDMNG